MDLKEQMDEFNKRWNIISTTSYEEEFLKFKIRILNVFDDIDQHLSHEGTTTFCQYYGIKEVCRSVVYGDFSQSISVKDRLEKEVDEKEFYRLIEIIFSLDIYETEGCGGEIAYNKGILFNQVSQAINLSNVNVSIARTGEEVVLYPKGEKLLDDKLVNTPLTFLDKVSSKHFIQALHFYETNEYIKSAESLRRALEEFLRYKLQNSKGLKQNITELQKKLKSSKCDSQIRNDIHLIFEYLDDYFNDNCKHNDGAVENLDNELLIYQVGLLMYYIDKK